MEVPADSERLQLLQPFPRWDGKDLTELTILVKAKGKTTTDHISPAGAWLRYRGHLDKISDNMFLGAVNAWSGETGKGTNPVTGESGQTFTKMARALKGRGIGWVVVGDENYGEGSSRERAAMSPRYLGGRVVIVKSSPANNRETGKVQVPPAGTVRDLPPAGSPEWARLAQLGRDAIRRGELGMVVLNGGMATRFGGVVKGVVDVLGPGRSFLALNVEDLQHAAKECGGRIQLFLMNSFATDQATRAHFAEHHDFGLPAEQVHMYTQFISMRLEKDGNLFVGKDGQPSFYGPGHGDFAPALRRSGLLQRFLGTMIRLARDAGARFATMVAVIVRFRDRLGDGRGSLTNRAPSPYHPPASEG